METMTIRLTERKDASPAVSISLGAKLEEIHQLPKGGREESCREEKSRVVKLNPMSILII